MTETVRIGHWQAFAYRIRDEQCLFGISKEKKIFIRFEILCPIIRIRIVKMCYAFCTEYTFYAIFMSNTLLRHRVYNECVINFESSIKWVFWRVISASDTTLRGNKTFPVFMTSIHVRMCEKVNAFINLRDLWHRFHI